ncbi:Nickel/cobalt efflux system [Kerstersia similis]
MLTRPRSRFSLWHVAPAAQVCPPRSWTGSLPACLAVVVLLLACGWASGAWAQGMSHPFGVPEASAGGRAYSQGWMAQISAWQSGFYRQLTGAVRTWRDGGGAWLLVWLSFAYGVFHALGPGHGKAVITAYVLANRQTVRNGAILSLVSAMVQALVAVVLVGLAVSVLQWGGATLTQATWWLELASFGCVALLGAWLVWKHAVHPAWRWWQGRTARARGQRAHSVPGQDSVPAHGHAHAPHGSDGHAALAQGHGHHHDLHRDHVHDHSHAQAQLAHDGGAASAQTVTAARTALQAHTHIEAHTHAHVHEHDGHVHDGSCGCGHVHIPPASSVAGELNWRQAWSALLAVGLRPCSGAIIVLVFAYSQGMFMAGVWSALAMGVGTGLTVAAMAVAALVAGNLATRLVGGEGRWGAILYGWIQALAACAVLVLGVLLFGGAWMSAAPLGG